MLKNIGIRDNVTPLIQTPHRLGLTAALHVVLQGVADSVNRIMNNKTTINTKVMVVFDFHVVYILFSDMPNRLYFCEAEAVVG